MSYPFDTDTTCHCGASYNGSDHCPACACEQFESYACDAGKLAIRIGELRIPAEETSSIGYVSQDQKELYRLDREFRNLTGRNRPAWL